MVTSDISVFKFAVICDCKLVIPFDNVLLLLVDDVFNVLNCVVNVFKATMAWFNDIKFVFTCEFKSVKFVFKVVIEVLLLLIFVSSFNWAVLIVSICGWYGLVVVPVVDVNNVVICPCKFNKSLASFVTWSDKLFVMLKHHYLLKLINLWFVFEVIQDYY